MTALMPRRLGLPARAQISNDDPKASVPQRERYEWLESRLREFKHLEPVNAQTVLEQRVVIGTVIRRGSWSLLGP
jgi:hypothetical protein